MWFLVSTERGAGPTAWDLIAEARMRGEDRTELQVAAGREALETCGAVCDLAEPIVRWLTPRETGTAGALDLLWAAIRPPGTERAADPPASAPARLGTPRGGALAPARPAPAKAPPSVARGSRAAGAPPVAGALTCVRGATRTDELGTWVTVLCPK